MVKCGFCGKTFNALERLRDKPLTQPDPGPPVSSEIEPQVEPEFIIPEQENEQIEAVTAADEEPVPEKPAVTITAGKASRPVSSPAAVTRTNGFRYTEALLAQPVQKAGWLNRFLWGFGIMLLIAFAASQLLWFNRDMVMARYPATIPWFERLCDRFGCEILRNRDPGSIELLNRDVRDHPRYKNALLVNATMMNRSQTVQAYPVVQLNLFDEDGKLIAYRRFQPQEYLDDSINILQGMAPNVPVHFVLEVLDSAKGAVSFEFEFH